jgi:peroxiredoxin
MISRINVPVVATLMLCFSASAAVAPWEIEEIMNKEAPHFTLEDISGKKLSLSLFKGKVILVNFWATWCIPCMNEMPSFNRLFQKYKERGLMVLGVSMDTSIEAVQKFLSKTDLGFPVLLDSDLSISHKYKVFAFPTTFLIDRDGVLREKYIGEMEWTDPETTKLIEEYLNK